MQQSQKSLENDRKLSSLQDRIQKLLLSLEELEDKPKQSQVIQTIQASKIQMFFQENALSSQNSKDFLQMLLEFLFKLKDSIRELHKEILEILQELYKL
jgi:hypothetical protein